MGKKKGKAAKRGKRRSGPSMADRADRHVLYEASVQSVEDEVAFLDTAFQELTGRRARVMREDFCGTAAAACEWVKGKKSRQAVAVDIDPDVLEWGRQRHVAALRKGEQARLRLVNGDVRTAGTGTADLACAFNFSWWTFKTRADLKTYFKAVLDSLAPDGVFFLDIYGGSDAYVEGEEETEYDDFTYVWDQNRFEPVSGAYTCYIHAAPGLRVPLATVDPAGAQGAAGRSGIRPQRRVLADHRQGRGLHRGIRAGRRGRGRPGLDHVRGRLQGRMRIRA